ncbi:MAG TPA: GAF domain-containing protein [Dehalococcoidia bacterium]|jgi:GAF domain-containing protein|nr:GAF domain-containing protein [Dehalococcoidia bacterium]
MTTSNFRTESAAAAAPAEGGPPTGAPPRDGEFQALRRLALLHSSTPRPVKPDRLLQAVCDLAKELTRGKYAALAVTDERDHTEGFYTSGLAPAQLKGLKVPPTGHGPLGSLRSDGKPVRIDDLDKHPYAFGFPPKHPVMKRMLGVPIWANGSVRGSMYVTDREDGEPFDDEDERAMVTLARHATYVIENFWY